MPTLRALTGILKESKPEVRVSADKGLARIIRKRGEKSMNFIKNPFIKTSLTQPYPEM
jgi:hypothetical protein